MATESIRTKGNVTDDGSILHIPGKLVLTFWQGLRNQGMQEQKAPNDHLTADMYTVYIPATR